MSRFGIIFCAILIVQVHSLSISPNNHVDAMEVAQIAKKLVVSLAHNAIKLHGDMTDLARAINRTSTDQLQDLLGNTTYKLFNLMNTHINTLVDQYKLEENGKTTDVVKCFQAHMHTLRTMMVNYSKITTMCIAPELKKLALVMIPLQQQLNVIDGYLINVSKMFDKCQDSTCILNVSVALYQELAKLPITLQKYAPDIMTISAMLSDSLKNCNQDQMLLLTTSFMETMNLATKCVSS